MRINVRKDYRNWTPKLNVKFSIRKLMKFRVMWFGQMRDVLFRTWSVGSKLYCRTTISGSDTSAGSSEHWFLPSYPYRGEKKRRRRKRGRSITHSSDTRDITRSDRWAPLSARRRNNTSSLCARHSPSRILRYFQLSVVLRRSICESVSYFIIYSLFLPGMIPLIESTPCLTLWPFQTDVSRFQRFNEIKLFYL